MVDKAPEGDDREVSIEIVQPKPAPTPVGVGAKGGDDDEEPSDGEPASEPSEADDK
jgi:ATP-dependent Clp protease ATP-binding subunit ClpC